MDENGQQILDGLRDHDTKLADGIECERRSSVKTFWTVICGLCSVIGLLAGFLLSDLRFMGQVTETKVRVESLQKQVDDNKDVVAARFKELKDQADQHYTENHTLILKIYERGNK
jgi:ElaB/YqjD/DUF883 family membrane-anchored ribosome-binding protein